MQNAKHDDVNGWYLDERLDFLNSQVFSYARRGFVFKFRFFNFPRILQTI